MMIGIDAVNVRKFRMRANKSEFLNRVFSDREKQYAAKYKDAILHLAGLFAAKEAVRKAFDCKIDFADVEILHKTNGKPYALIGKEKKRVEVSISYAENVAVAVAIVF